MRSFLPIRGFAPISWSISVTATPPSCDRKTNDWRSMKPVASSSPMMSVELYTADTANGLRAAIALEEAGIPYRAHVLNLVAGDQRTPAFRELNPVGSVPFVLKSRKGRKPLLIAQSG